MNVQLQRFVLVVLVAGWLLSALGVVYAKHESRKLFIELQDLRAERDKMNIEFGKLQLEQSTWAAHGRVERIARNKLHMTIPSTNSVVMVKP
jgi:cell division protein FtsL